jgi:hypothetical protein
MRLRLLFLSAASFAWMAAAAPAVGEPSPAMALVKLIRTATALGFVLSWLVMAAAIIAFAYLVAEWRRPLFERGRELFVAHLGRSFALGLVNVLLFFAAGAFLVATQFPIVAQVGVVLWLAVLVGLLGSRAMLYQMIGARMSGGIPDPESPASFGDHLRGGIVAELAFMLPIVGWIAAIVLNLATFGALVGAMLSRSGDRQAKPAADQA